MTDLAVEAAELARVRGDAEAILARHTGQTVERVRADTEHALVLSGPAAVEYGVADLVPDRVDSGRQELEARTALRPGVDPETLG